MQQRIFTNADIYHRFISSHCRCSAAKWEKTAFCHGCYGDLSREAKMRLRAKFGRGFETAYRTAILELEDVERLCSECGVNFEREEHREFCIWADYFS